MGCVIRYKGQSISEEQFLQYLNKQITINNLFNENESLANSVYEALGFKNKLKTTLGKELEYKDPYVPQNRLKSFKQYEVLNESGDNIGTVVVEYRGNETVILHPKLNVTNKGYGKDLYKLISSKFNVEVQEWSEGAIANSDSAKKMWDSLEKEGSAKRIINAEQGDNFRVLNYSNQLTPQQKQQALQLYSQYLDTIFPDSQVKDIVYHTTPNKFDKFDKDFIGKGIGNTTEGVGFYFSNRRKSYLEYKKIVNLSKPIESVSLYSQEILEDKIKNLKKVLEKNNLTLDFEDLEFIQDAERKLGWIDYINIEKELEDYFNYRDKLISESQSKWLNEDNNPYEELEERFQQSLDLQDSTNLLSVLINLKSPKIFNNRQSLKDNNSLINNDGTITNIGNNDIQYVVFEPEQIHVLSSKADIQGFKDFMSFENSEFSKYGTYQQFRDFVTSKSSIEIENRLIETGKIDRVC